MMYHISRSGKFVDAKLLQAQKSDFSFCTEMRNVDIFMKVSSKGNAKIVFKEKQVFSFCI